MKTRRSYGERFMEEEEEDQKGEGFLSFDWHDRTRSIIFP
jgi:hypothetical protein